MSEKINPETAQGATHLASGWVIFMIALVILVGTHQLINRIYGVIRARGN
jgi:hypothetical protein